MFVAIRDCFLSREDPFKTLADLGLKAVELDVNKECKAGALSPKGVQPHDLSTKEGRAQFQALLKSKGVTVSAFLMSNNFASPDLDGEIKALVKVAQACEEMCIPVMRIDFLPHSTMEEPEFMKRCIQAAKQAIAATSKLQFGIENHGGTSNRPEFLDKVFNGAGDKRLGLTLDTGNFYWYGHPLDEVYKLMEKYASRVYHTHCKNIKYPADKRNVRREVGWEYGQYVCPINEGDVDHARVIAILRKAGYNRGLTIEDESLGKFPAEKHVEILRKEADYLKALV